MLEVAAEHVLWDVIEEHLDEAEFSWRQWETALTSPRYTLARMADGPERTLLAHVDGLASGATPVRERLLLTTLEEAEPPPLARLIPVLLALVQSGHWGPVAATLASEDRVLGAAAERAAVLAGPRDRGPWLEAALAAAPDPARRTRLLRVAAGWGLSLDNLVAPLQSADGDETQAAATAARWADPDRHLPVLEWLLDHPLAPVREAALVSALFLRSGRAWRTCEARAADRGTPDATAMLLVALLGEGPAQQPLLDQLGRVEHREAALFALGYSGQAAHAERLLPLLAHHDERVAKLAAEAFSTLTGLDTARPPYASQAEPVRFVTQVREEEEPPIETVPLPEEDRPLPDGEAITRWWKERGPALPPRQRLLAGAPWTPASAADFLREAPLRRRPPVALWAGLRHGVRIDPQAFSPRQQAQLGALRAIGAG
jgi:uncharacterized protein (TIGR02270 family)